MEDEENDERGLRENKPKDETLETKSHCGSTDIIISYIKAKTSVSLESVCVENRSPSVLIR